MSGTASAREPRVQINYNEQSMNDRQAEGIMRDAADELRRIGEANGYSVSTSNTATSSVREFDGRGERKIRLIVEYTVTEEAGNTGTGGAPRQNR